MLSDIGGTHQQAALSRFKVSAVPNGSRLTDRRNSCEANFNRLCFPNPSPDPQT